MSYYVLLFYTIDYDLFVLLFYTCDYDLFVIYDYERKYLLVRMNSYISPCKLL